MKKVLFLCLIAFIFIGCQKEADVASSNLSTAADQFQVDRRVIFYDAIQGIYLLTITGKCSINKDNIDNQLEVTCKCGPTEYKKHFLGLSDNVTYFVEQLKQVPVNVYRYKVIFRPEVIIPDIDMETNSK